MPKLSNEDVRAFLSEPGHLAPIGTTDADGTPRVLPLWFILHDDAICFGHVGTRVGMAQDVQA